MIFLCSVSDYSSDLIFENAACLKSQKLETQMQVSVSKSSYF